MIVLIPLLKVWKTCSRIEVRPVEKLDYTVILPVHFTSARHQILIKVTDIVLGAGEEFEDPSWHTEGLFREHIIMTGLYFSQRDPPLQGGAIEFERYFDEQETKYLLRGPLAKIKEEERDINFRTQWFRDTIGRWMKPLGSFSSPEAGDTIVFPNCDRYRFGKLKNPLLDRSLTQRLVRISLIHPHRRLLSTANVPSLQDERGKMPLAAALRMRSQINQERHLN